MGKGLKEFAEKRGLKKLFRRENLIILVLSGVLLLIIALPLKSSEQSSKDNTSNSAAQKESNLLEGLGLSSGSSGGASSGANYAEGESAQQFSNYGSSQSADAYRQYMEKRLTNLLLAIDGIGKVEVMITLESSAEVVIDKDTTVTSSDTTEKDAQGGNREVSQWERQESTVTGAEGNASQPYVVKTLVPKVAGVVVVAQGAGSAAMNQNISEAVDALFDVGAHKIKVLKMKMDE
jgi:stage III sporulation protein AG